MADQSDAARGPADPHRYLPLLTWVLLVLVFAWLGVWFFVYRPTTEEQLRQAAFSRAIDFISQNYVAEVSPEELYHAAMRGMVESLGDQHSMFATPSEERELRARAEGEFGGIGIRVTLSDGHLLVLEVFAGSPAEEGGLAEGDLITHVDGREIKGRPMQAAVEMIRGEKGTRVELTFRRPTSGQTLAAVVERDTISVPNVRWEVLEGGIGRLEIAMFDMDCADDVAEGLDELADAGVRGLVMDLRGNVGGVMDQAVRICDMFLAGGLILRLTGRAVQVDPEMADEDVRVGRDVPVAVLVDHATASAAEILAGALQANGRATVIGTKTVGKGAVNSVVELPDGSGLLLTVAHYTLAGGRTVEGQGIEPDIVVGELPPLPEEREAEDVAEWLRRHRAARQEQFERAVRFIEKELGAD